LREHRNPACRDLRRRAIERRRLDVGHDHVVAALRGEAREFQPEA